MALCCCFASDPPDEKAHASVVIQLGYCWYQVGIQHLCTKPHCLFHISFGGLLLKCLSSTLFVIRTGIVQGSPIPMESRVGCTVPLSSYKSCQQKKLSFLFNIPEAFSKNIQSESKTYFLPHKIQNTDPQKPQTQPECSKCHCTRLW